MQGRELTVVAAARRRIGLVLVSTAVGLGVAAGVVATSSQTYTSSIQLYVSVAPEVAAGRNVFNSLTFVEGRAATYASLVGNRSFEEAVAEEIGVPDDLELLAVVDPETALLRISAGGSSPELAQQAARAAADRLIELAPPLDAVAAEDAPPGTPAVPSVQLTVSEDAPLPTSPDSPVVPLFLAIGLFGGAALGLAGATLAARSDNRIHEPDDLGDLADRVGPVFWLPRSRPTSGARREEYMLRLAALHHEFTALPQSQGSLLVLAAPTPRHVPAASQVAEDLTRVLSEGGRSTAVARMQSRGGGLSDPGLSDVLAGTHSMSAVVTAGQAGRVTVGPGTAPLRLLTASAADMSALVAELNRLADVIVIDAPDLSAPAGTAVLSGVADAVLVVAGRGVADAEELLDSRATIRRWRGSYLGVLLAPRGGVRLSLPTRRAAPTSTPARDDGSRRPSRIP